MWRLSLSRSQHVAPNGPWVARDGSAINISLLTEIVAPVLLKRLRAVLLSVKLFVDCAIFVGARVCDPQQLRPKPSLRQIPSVLCCPVLRLTEPRSVGCGFASLTNMRTSPLPDSGERATVQHVLRSDLQRLLLLSMRPKPRRFFVAKTICSQSRKVSVGSFV